MHFLFFDTETTGLPKNWKAPVEDLKNWPRMIQLAWLLYDEEGNEVIRSNDIIKPENFRIPKAASAIHGISTEKAMEEGIPLEEALRKFIYAFDSTDYLVAHNIEFDDKIVGAELLRKRIESDFFKQKRICTMKSSIRFCALPGKYSKYKNPSLTQLYTKLFGQGFDDAHDALADVVACAEAFFELQKKGVIRV
jgi:DNA polymerase-3 subunit epsilon